MGIKNFKKFLEDVRLGDNSRLSGDENNSFYQIFKRGQGNLFEIDAELITFIKKINLKIEWFDDPDHSIINRIMLRAKSFKKITEFNEYIEIISPKIVDYIINIDKSGKYSLYDDEYKITLIVNLTKNDLTKIKIISLINGLSEKDVIKTFNL